MSRRGLQRALVVALHDPGFAAALRVDPGAALAPFGLEAAEAAALGAVDPRAFAIDGLRRRRVLKAIAPELKASLAIALAEVRAFGFAEAFFASPCFHRAVQGDQPLVLALADYLAAALADGRLRSTHLPGVLAIERAQAEVRRDRPGPPPPGLSRAPGLRLVAADSNALAALQAAERHLFELSLLPHIALCDDRPALDLPAPDPAAAPLHLSVRAETGEAALAELPEPLFRSLGALTAAAGPLHRADVPSVLAAVGLRVRDSDKLIDDLIADGYLIESAASSR